MKALISKKKKNRHVIFVRFIYFGPDLSIFGKYLCVHVYVSVSQTFCGWCNWKTNITNQNIMKLCNHLHTVDNSCLATFGENCSKEDCVVPLFPKLF